MRRLLSMDGGGVLSLATLTMLRRIEEKFPGFLARADAFAGTSAGGMNALLLAAHENPADGLDDAFDLWDGTAPIYDSGLCRDLGALAGKVAVYDNTNLEAFLRSRLGNRRLKELYHRVVAVTVKLDAQLPGGHRAWAPKVFDSHCSVDPQDADELAVDVGVRTGAFPITFPVYQGYVDGGVVANNPSLCLLLHEVKRVKLAASAVLPETRLLSVGTGAGVAAIAGCDLDWGYGEWLFKRGNPGLFTDMVISAPMELVTEQCALLLGGEGFFRLNPWPEKVVTPSKSRGVAADGPIDQMRQKSLLLGETADLDPTFRWIEASGWMEEGDAKEEPTGTMPRRTARSPRAPGAAKGT
ncbi:patatin-like phospholipase family protein [Niveispirillum sp. KHB5.9]|uniref:patatin-like phospholipase family protein n=1 Tax=Niveispirillum sp. KHB5.9 TaxID=3400269 RepID=UPI003A8636B6